MKTEAPDGERYCSYCEDWTNHEISVERSGSSYTEYGVCTICGADQENEREDGDTDY